MTYNGFFFFLQKFELLYVQTQCIYWNRETIINILLFLNSRKNKREKKRKIMAICLILIGLTLTISHS